MADMETDPIGAKLDDISDHGFSGLGKVLFDKQTNALRAVLELHKRHDGLTHTPLNKATHDLPYSTCEYCEDAGYANWPCPTVAAIAAHLGVDPTPSDTP